LLQLFVTDITLFSKSIQEAVCEDDGIRICIMRKPDFSAEWDILMPRLAPSLELLRSYNKGETSWDNYVVQFTKDVILGQERYLKLLLEMAQRHTVTVLCWEKAAEQCHRRLIVEAVATMDPSLEVGIK